MPELTDAATIDLESATNERTGLDKTDEADANRWTKYGHDRLYLEGPAKFEKNSTYVDLETGELEDAPSSKHSADVTIEGTTATIEVHKDGKGHLYTFTLAADGEDFEPVDDEDENGPEVVTDGGEDATAHVSDEDIEQAIRLKDDPDHEDALSVTEVRDMLAHIQSDFETFWGEIVEAIQSSHLEVLADNGDVIVIRDDDMAEWTEWLNAAGIDDEIARSVVQLAHNAAGSRIADFQAGASDLLVVRKPRSFDGGRDYVEAVVNGLQKRGLSPGQAWAYYGVEIRGESRNAWGRRKGDHDHKNVSDALENAKSKLP